MKALWLAFAVLFQVVWSADIPLPPCTDYEGKSGRCSLLVQCATFFPDLAKLSRSPCDITVNQRGVCCSALNVAPKGPATVAPLPPPSPARKSKISTSQLNSGCDKSIRKQEMKRQFEDKLLSENIIAPEGSPVFFHAKLFQANKNIINRGQIGALVLDAGHLVAEELQLRPEDAVSSLSTFTMQDTIIANMCPKVPDCTRRTKYRTIDGSCNNLRNPHWGQAGVAFYRLLPPHYNDGLSSFRVGHDGQPLPSPRSLSSATVVNRDDVYDDYTLFVMQWGQFLDHDITHTPITKGSNSSDITCCVSGSIRPPTQLHPDCKPIIIPTQDPFYGKFGQKCMEFVRSMAAIPESCKFGPREQMNQITSFIDASNVYGSSEAELRNLREFSGGRMKAILTRDKRSLLPPTTHDDMCHSVVANRHCFAAGDTRVNEQPNLAVLHTVWMRQHNLVAIELARLNPLWSDETIYQETRRIIAAQMQHITYNEYLPIVLGSHFVETFGLVPQKGGYFNGYDPTLDPTISNSFAAAAFRYGHTLIDSKVQGYSRFGTREMDTKLRNVQFSPFFLYDKGAHDGLIRGLAIQPSQKFDNFFSEELTNHLFARNNSFGMDLVALNLQRGRDHGLPSYVQWRKVCRLKPVKTFADLSDVMHPDATRYLSTLYRHVEDIDLFIGGILEFPVAGALVGHTFLCILGDQFYRLKAGDRFYYENSGSESFTPNQLEQIKRTSLARVLCDTSDEMTLMQPLAFLHAKFTNKRTSCGQDSQIPHLDYSHWKEALN